MAITKKLGDIEVVDANKIKAIEETLYDKTVLTKELDEIEGIIGFSFKLSKPVSYFVHTT